MVPFVLYETIQDNQAMTMVSMIKMMISTLPMVRI